MTDLKTILFDLDGTLLDTAPDIIFALNQLRQDAGLAALPYHELRKKVGLGSKEMITYALQVDQQHPDFNFLRDKFLQIYQKHVADHTTFFPKMDIVLNHLEENNIPWGIVTNKLTCHTLGLLKALQIDHKPQCVVCGDTLTKAKPDPLPILHACALLKIDPSACLFIGDAAVDVIASKAAGTRSLVALYGYADESDPYSWAADGYINEPIEILKWI